LPSIDNDTMTVSSIATGNGIVIATIE